MTKNYNDKIVQASFGFWNAMITFHGVLFSIFSASLLNLDKINYWLLTIIITSFISIVLIVISYDKTKKFYLLLDEMEDDKVVPISKHSRFVKISVFVAKYSIIFQALVILIYLLTKY